MTYDNGQARESTRADIKAAVREEFTLIHAELLASLRLIIKDEIQIFNKIMEDDMIKKLDQLLKVGQNG